MLPGSGNPSCAPAACHSGTTPTPESERLNAITCCTCGNAEQSILSQLSTFSASISRQSNNLRHVRLGSPTNRFVRSSAAAFPWESARARRGVAYARLARLWREESRAVTNSYNRCCDMAATMPEAGKPRLRLGLEHQPPVLAGVAFSLLVLSKPGNRQTVQRFHASLGGGRDTAMPHGAPAVGRGGGRDTYGASRISDGGRPAC